MDIIIRRGKPTGRTRSREDEVMRKEWGTSSFRSEEAADKCDFLERRVREKTGAENIQIPGKLIDGV